MKMTKKKIVLQDGRYLIYYSFTQADSGEHRAESSEARGETTSPLSTLHSQPADAGAAGGRE